MVSATNYVQFYGKAQSAYLQGNFVEASTVIAQMAEEFPDDPSVLLLRGHVFLGLQQYDLACRQYELVLQLTNKPELLDCASKGLEQAQQFQSQESSSEFSFEKSPSVTDASDFLSWQKEADDSSLAWENDLHVDELDWQGDRFVEEDNLGEPTLGQAQPFSNPFETDSQRNGKKSLEDLPKEDFAHAISQNNGNAVSHTQSPAISSSWSTMPDSPFSDFSLSEMDLESEVVKAEGAAGFPETGERTFLVSPAAKENSSLLSNVKTEDAYPSARNGSHLLEEIDSFSDENLEDFSKVDLSEVTLDLSNSDLLGQNGDNLSRNINPESNSDLSSSEAVEISGWTDSIGATITDIGIASESLAKPTVEVEQGKLASFKNASLRQKQWIVAVAAGIASAFVVLSISGLNSLLTSEKKPEKATSSGEKSEKIANTAKISEPTGVSRSKVDLWAVLLTGAASFSVTLILGQIATTQIKRSLEDLQVQLNAIYQGNFNVKATIYSEDEVGQLATRFNQVTRAILTTTSEAQRRAAETEQAKENLQRQVIRLLDDVEGAARGDLTVQAEVSADVLGAVADAFNLTIHNLRDIVSQVKKAAKQVNKGSTDSELFARNQSSDALRMAEELAVTLNSVQMMTESIQRVAENAREAEEVARSSSVTALKGGEAVERTVAGILQIRETVSETARKVKRLAEASQEISKIVALISQIASRTNLLALNASIQAARAGEAGRGFAIVADEVRQLADRSAKSLKEIEHIVLQIQSETGSVMTAMEEGIQQVIDVTERSEQAKSSLEDIIQVSNHINTLVLSITANTVEQRENSQAVAQVMQSVELTAQETSQESQRVAGSLQNLVGISRDLLASVERFRVDNHDNK
jgi:twitching motility protein PilJ